jgi:hypothetical protein
LFLCELPKSTHTHLEMTPDERPGQDSRRTGDTPMTSQTALPSPTQCSAWEAYNASYGAPAQEAYRALGRELYHQALGERIEQMFAYGDAQNARLALVIALRDSPATLEEAASR